MTLKLFCFIVMLFSVQGIASASHNSLENIQVSRYIDISTQLVIVNTQIKVINFLDEHIPTYVYIVDPQWVEYLSYIEVLDSNKNLLVVDKTTELDKSGKTVLRCNIWLPEPLSSGATTELVVSMIITNYLRSFPNTVKQNEKHTVLFPFNVYYHTMYYTHEQTTNLFMGTTKAALIDGAMYSIGNDSEYGLQYGPFYDVEPFKYARSVFHYENNSPFLIVEKVERFIKLSHWGYVSVWDNIQLLHSGPKLTGPFKRSFHKDKHESSQDTKIEKIVSTLPADAFDIYLKDEIGLIWSYSLSYDDPDEVSVSIQPRFLLYGGWRIDYEIGYSLPIRGFVADLGNNEYTLSFPLLDKIFPNMIIKEAEVNIILPEGATFGGIDPTFAMENKTNEKYCYYFDVTCREIVKFKLYNIVERHIINFSLTYSSPKLHMIVKPIAIAVFINLFLIFLKISFGTYYFSTLSDDIVIKSNTHTEPPAMKKKNKKNKAKCF